MSWFRRNGKPVLRGSHGVHDGLHPEKLEDTPVIFQAAMRCGIADISGRLGRIEMLVTGKANEPDLRNKELTALAKMARNTISYLEAQKPYDKGRDLRGFYPRFVNDTEIMINKILSSVETGSEVSTTGVLDATGKRKTK